MIELLKIIVDTVSRVLPGISSNRRDNKLNAIGAELLMLYVQVNEALIRAEDIVESLEVYRERMARHISTGDDPHALTGGSWIRFKVEQQRSSLAKIGETMQRWGGQLQIIDGDSYAQLIPLLRGKSNALDALLSIMGRGELVLDMETALAIGWMRSNNIDSSLSFQRNIAAREEMARNSIPTDTTWDEPVYQMITNYFEHRNPREQLQEIRNVLTRIHEALKSQFTVEDILLQVGDRRFASNYNGDSFW